MLVAEHVSCCFTSLVLVCILAFSFTFDYVLLLAFLSPHPPSIHRFIFAYRIRDSHSGRGGERKLYLFLLARRSLREAQSLRNKKSNNPVLHVDSFHLFPFMLTFPLLHCFCLFVCLFVCFLYLFCSLYYLVCSLWYL